MWKLLKYMKEYRKESVCAPLFKLLEASFELLVPLVMARIIDVGIKNQDTGYILRMCLLMVALGLIGLACSVTAQYFSAKAAVGFSAKLRQVLFAHVQALSFTEMDDIGTSTLITRMTSDINQVQSGVNLFLRLFMRSPFIVFGAMIMAFTIDVKAAFVFVVVIPVLCVIVFGIMLASIPLYRRVQERLDRVVRVTRENLLGVRVIRAFCREPQEIKSFDESNEALVKVQLLSGRVSALMNPLTYVVINVGLIALLYTGAQRVDAGAITQGSVVALVNYMSQILVELVKLANLIITVTKAIACGNRIQKIMEVPAGMKVREAAGSEAVSDGAGGQIVSENAGLQTGRDSDGAQISMRSEATAEAKSSGEVHDLHSRTQKERQESGENAAPAVSFDQVMFRYRGAGDDALTDLSFTANRGETIGVIGGTGSGKTSLVSLIPRFYDVREGSVKVNGKDVRDYPLDELRRKVGIVMQKPVLFKGTIRSNLLWGNENATDEDLIEAVRAAQAEDVVLAHSGENAQKETDENKKYAMLVEGLDAPVEQEGRNFSGGQKQRLTIARALVRHPEILILDDSASALDFATDARLRKAIRELSHRKNADGMENVNGGHKVETDETENVSNGQRNVGGVNSAANGAETVTDRKNVSDVGRESAPVNTMALSEEAVMTVFIVSQRTSSIAHADKIIVLDDGKVAGIGTHEELLAGCEVYRETHYSQFPKQEEPEKETRKQGSASDEEGLRSKQPSGGEKSQADLASDGKNSKRKRIRNGGDSRSKNTPGGKSASGDDFPGKAGQTKGVLA